ncbi:permease-like cell division protein FtsX [Bacteroidia bacterium]|nr:permease-like cell division protein FtsX [Bacteroidia bacterium]
MGSTKPSGFTIIATLSIVIFLLGLLGVLIINASNLNSHIKDNVEVTVFFNTTIQDEDAELISDSIQKLPFASDGEFVSSEEAVFNFKNEIGEDFVEILGNNPLPASLELSIRKEFADEASLMQLERKIGAIDGVLEVSYPQNVFQQIDRNRRMISFWLVALSVILVVVAFVLMSNTVRLLIYSDRFIIKNQQLIGATEKFIMRPYKRKALNWALISFSIGTVLLFALIWLIFSWLNVSMDMNMSAIADHFTENWYQYILMLFLLLLGGTVVILISTHFATKKYLQTHTNNLYQ